MKCKIYPGSMGAVITAVDLFGIERVDAGTWPGPVYVNDVREDEFEPAKKLLEERSLTLEKI